MTEVVPFLEVQLAYGRQILEALLEYLESNNISPDGEAMLVEDLPYGRAKATIKQTDSSQPSVLDSEILANVEVFYPHRNEGTYDEPTFIYSIDSAGTLYRDEQQLEEGEAAFVYAYLERIVLPAGGDTTDRRVMMRRRIGPPMIAAVLSSLDNLAKQSLEEAQLLEIAKEREYANFIFEWTKQSKQFEHVSEALLGLIGIMTLRVGYQENDLFDHVELTLKKITQSQGAAFDNFTNGQEFKSSMRETIDSQAGIVGSIVFPAYLAAKYDCISREQLLNRINQTPLSEICEIMSGSDFTEALELLAMAPNGSLGFNVFPEIRYSEDLEESESHYEADNTMSYIRGSQGFKVYEFFIKYSDGSVRLNPRWPAEARQAIRLEAEKEDNESELGPSIGCPMLLKTVNLEPIDTSPEQLTAIAMVPGLEVSTRDHKTRIKFHRRPILELHQVHLQTLKQFRDVT